MAFLEAANPEGRPNKVSPQLAAHIGLTSSRSLTSSAEAQDHYHKQYPE